MERKSKTDKVPFVYQRGSLKLLGSTDNDRRVVRVDTVLYRIGQIIFALAALLGALCQFLGK